MAERVRRGAVWTVAGGSDYAGKPRPAVVVLQDDAFDATTSVTVCPLTTRAVDAPLARVPVEPSNENGLRLASHLMTDKIMTVPRAKLRQNIGRLSDEDLLCLNRAVLVFLGLAGSR